MKQDMAKKQDNQAKFFAILGLVASLVLMLFIKRFMPWMEHRVEAAGIAGPILMIFIYAVFSATPFPTDSFTVLCGALWGPLWGTLISWMGNNAAAVVEYFIGVSVGTATNLDLKNKKLPFGLDKVPVDSPWFLILGRLVPGFGGKMVSLLSGIYKVPLWKYIWTAAIGNLVGATILALSGYGLFTIL